MLRIVESKFIKSAVYSKDFPPSEKLDVAFVGKSNVGKSSMINTILNRKAIAKISSTPGKTRLINFFEIRYILDEDGNDGLINFIDLPGYGYAKVSKTERDSWQKMVQGYFNKREQIRGVIVLIDIRHKADPKDMVMIEMLKDRNIPYKIAATKADKIPKSKVNNLLIKLAQQHGIKREDLVAFSSLKKTGIPGILNWIQEQIC
jgi:GTP-binding protein